MQMPEFGVLNSTMNFSPQKSQSATFPSEKPAARIEPSSLKVTPWTQSRPEWNGISRSRESSLTDCKDERNCEEGWGLPIDLHGI